MPYTLPRRTYHKAHRLGWLGLDGLVDSILNLPGELVLVNKLLHRHDDGECSCAVVDDVWMMCGCICICISVHKGESKNFGEGS